MGQYGQHGKMATQCRRQRRIRNLRFPLWTQVSDSLPLWHPRPDYEREAPQRPLTPFRMDGTPPIRTTGPPGIHAPGRAFWESQPWPDMDSYREVPPHPQRDGRQVRACRRIRFTYALAPTPSPSFDRRNPQFHPFTGTFHQLTLFPSHHLQPVDFRLNPLPMLTLKAEG